MLGWADGATRSDICPQPFRVLFLVECLPALVNRLRPLNAGIASALPPPRRVLKPAGGPAVLGVPRRPAVRKVCFRQC